MRLLYYDLRLLISSELLISIYSAQRLEMASGQSAQPPISFSDAFGRLKDQVSEDDGRLFASTTMKDVRDTAVQIERHLEERRSLRGFRRMEPFLAGLEQYSKVVEVLCNGTPYLPWIWVR